MPALLLATLLAATAPARGARLEAGQKAFVQGDFDAALKALDLAAAEGGDDATLARVHLLRGQCFAAKGDLGKAEDAFALALEASPLASLDASRVDPSVVRLLDALRERLTGTVQVASEPAGAALELDGQARGEAPQELTVPLGRHEVRARWKDGTAQATVVVHARRVQSVMLALAVAPAAPVPVAPPAAPPEEPARHLVSPYGELRGVSENGAVDGGLELGAGVALPWSRVGLSVRLAPSFALAPRAAFVVPLWRERLHAFVELSLPLAFRRDGTAFGLGGSGGVDFAPLRWLALFAQVGGRHFFQNPNSLVNDRLVVEGGARLQW
ncbi:MAG: tetratricopeptide repeat protein [Myxococcaceae bacterium]|nr:tetratricopeptide repeat protein [Myxococcaceae bacterium]